MNQNSQAVNWKKMNSDLALRLMDNNNGNHMYLASFQNSDSEDDQSGGIDLNLQCEDDKSYALPLSEGNLRLQSSNVCMRISFSQSVESYTCHYCKVNFLSENHLTQHMNSSHYSGTDQDMESDDDDDEEEEEESPAVVSYYRNGYLGYNTGYSINGCSNGHNNGHSNGHSSNPGNGHSNGNGVVPSTAVQELTPPRTPTLWPKKVKTSKPKRKKAGSQSKAAASRPPIVLTIKKSQSDPGIQQHQRAANNEANGIHSAGPNTPPAISGKNAEASSDSTSEMVDVEASSPSSSPASIKSQPMEQTVTEVKKRGSGNIFTCQTCSKSYVTKYALKRHIATHSEDRPYTCSFPNCTGAFKLKSRLTDHVRYVHKQRTQRTAGRSQSLPITSTPTLAKALLSPTTFGSGTATATNSTTASDSSNHAVTSGKSAAPKSVKCTWPHCPREFKDAYNLRTHMCLHTGEMPVHCKLCQYTCIQKAALDHHMKAKHPEAL